jgi:tetratricopeptide (TPR) repeat protein
MPKTKRPKSGRAVEGETPESRGRLGTVVKWVGGGTAVLSLVFGLRQLTVLISDARDRQRQVTELIGMGKLQQEARDYGSAWKSLGRAAELQAKESRIRAAQEDLAMAWLDDIRGSQGTTPFTAIVDTLVPVLSRGVVAAEGARKADLLAHLGWADFLRWRDGQRSLEPAERYRQALAVDSQNVYAHAMLAHWTLWNGGDLEDANRHFAAAVRSGRERPYVRRLQLAALANMPDGEGDFEMLRVVNEMRKSNEPLDPYAQSRIWQVYYSRFVSSPAEDSVEHLFAAIPPAEQVATYRWVFGNSEYVKSKAFLYEYHLARLQDAAGQDADALATYRSVRVKLTPDVIDRIRRRVDSAIARLSKAH